MCSSLEGQKRAWDFPRNWSQRPLWVCNLSAGKGPPEPHTQPRLLSHLHSPRLWVFGRMEEFKTVTPSWHYLPSSVLEVLLPWSLVCLTPWKCIMAKLLIFFQTKKGNSLPPPLLVWVKSLPSCQLALVRGDSISYLKIFFYHRKFQAYTEVEKSVRRPLSSSAAEIQPSSSCADSRQIHEHMDWTLARRCSRPALNIWMFASRNICLFILKTGSHY